MTHDVFYNSDPDTQGRCSVRLPLQALYMSISLYVCVCDEWARSGAGQGRSGGGLGWQVTKLRKKKKSKTPKYLCHWPCVVTCLSLPCPKSKRVQLEFTNRAMPPRHNVNTQTTHRHEEDRKDPNYDLVSVFVSEDAVTPSGPLFRLTSKNQKHPGSEMCSVRECSASDSAILE